MEVGWDAVAVDEDNWKQQDTVFPNISIWGHNPPGTGSMSLNLGSLRNGARSLLKNEYVP